jgi:hypothetical protein
VAGAVPVTTLLHDKLTIEVFNRTSLWSVWGQTMSETNIPEDTEEHLGRDLIAFINSFDTSEIELIDAHATDPVEWVKAQRQKQAARLDPFWNGEK